MQSLGAGKAVSQVHILLDPLAGLVGWTRTKPSRPSRGCIPKNNPIHTRLSLVRNTKDLGKLLGWVACLSCSFPGPVPVCHHRDHRDLHLGRVPQVPAHTQAGLHSGLLRLLLHHGLSDDHSGKQPAGHRRGDSTRGGPKAHPFTLRSQTHKSSQSLSRLCRQHQLIRDSAHRWKHVTLATTKVTCSIFIIEM